MRKPALFVLIPLILVLSSCSMSGANLSGEWDVIVTNSSGSAGGFTATIFQNGSGLSGSANMGGDVSYVVDGEVTGQSFT
jgi:hypothetical protein